MNTVASQSDQGAVSSRPVKPKGFPLKLAVLIALLIVIVAGGLVAYLAVRHTSKQPPSITLYYDDGKTVLWRDNNPSVPPTSQPTNAPYFVNSVRSQLTQEFGTFYYKLGAWQVTTSLNASLEAKAEALVASNLSNLTNKIGSKADNEATVLEDVKTGQIKALVGGVNINNADYGLINYTKTPILPGSSIEPFDYAALIDNTTNYGAGTAIADSLKPLPGYPCTSQPSVPQGANCLQDYDFQAPGTIPIRYALGGERNIPAVEAMYGSVPNDSSPSKTNSVNQVINLINQSSVNNSYNCYAAGSQISLGTPGNTTQCYGSSALGGGAYITLANETQALSTLANNGQRVAQVSIVSVKLNGKVKLAWQNPAAKQVIKPDTAYIINNIMSDPNASYMPGSCTATSCTPISTGGYKFQRDNGWTLAEDNGMTNFSTDAVMASWSAKFAVVSWAGNHTQIIDISPSSSTPTYVLSAPLTRGLMEAADATSTVANWTKPSDIKTLPALVLSKPITSGDVVPSPTTDIYPSWYKP